MDDHSMHSCPGTLGVAGGGWREEDVVAGQIIIPLVRLAYDLYGQADAVGERFCRELAQLAQGSARLLLRDQATERAALALSAAVRLKLPVEYGGITHGELFIACDTQESTYPALSVETSSTLARMCGWLLHVLEEGALLNFQSQRIPVARPVSLSRRQLDVLRYMARGADTGAIAHALHISAATVETHRRAIYARLGVHAWIEAILVGHECGLISLIGTPAA